MEGVVSQNMEHVHQQNLGGRDDGRYRVMFAGNVCIPEWTGGCGSKLRPRVGPTGVEGHEKGDDESRGSGEKGYSVSKR